MQKKHRIALISLLASCATLAGSFCSISCDKKEEEIIVDPKVIAPETKQATCVIQSQWASQIFVGFRYEGSIDPNKLVVHNTFKQGYVKFESRIVGWDASNNSFGVEIRANSVAIGKTTGKISFVYDNKDLPLESDGLFEINFVNPSYIGSPDNYSDTQILSQEDKATFVFSHFTYHNFLEGGEKITVEDSFSRKGIDIQTSIDQLTDDSFNVVVSVATTQPTTLSGHFTFYYDGQKIESAPTDEFTIVIKHKVDIIMPTAQSLSSHIDQKGNSRVVFSGFRYESIDDPTQINIESSFEKDLTYGTATVSIYNIQPSRQTFDILVSIADSKIVENLQGDFTLSYDGLTWQTEKEFAITLIKPIPKNYLVINEYTHELQGLNITPEQLLEFNELEVPRTIEKIKDDAFNAAFVNNSVHFINIPNDGMLNYIGTNAFMGCTGIKGEINIPGTVENVKASAFQSLTNCQKVSFFSSTTPQTFETDAFADCGATNALILPFCATTLQDRAFKNSKFSSISFSESCNSVGNQAFCDMTNVTEIDLSAYRSVPDWISFAPKDCEIFKNVGTAQPELEKIVWINENVDSERETIESKLFHRMELDPSGQLNWKIKIKE